jgi:hypothetical protein
MYLPINTGGKRAEKREGQQKKETNREKQRGRNG